MSDNIRLMQFHVKFVIVPYNFIENNTDICKCNSIYMNSRYHPMFDLLFNPSVYITLPFKHSKELHCLFPQTLHMTGRGFSPEHVQLVAAVPQVFTIATYF